MKIRNPIDVINAKDMITIGQLKYFGHDPEVVLMPVLVDAMIFVQKMTGVKKFLDEEGIRMICGYVADEYNIFTLADTSAFAHRIIKGAFGEEYENISAAKIIRWVDRYMSDRADEICDYKLKQDKKEAEPREVDPEGLRRMAKAFGRINKEYLESQKNKQPNYLSISEYIERNGLDKEEFRGQLKERFEEDLAEVLKKHEGYDLQNVPPELYQAMLRKFRRDFLTFENKKLK